MHKIVKKILGAARINEKDTFFSVYDGYVFDIARNSEDDDWYIRVKPEEGAFLYDGYYWNSEGDPIEIVIVEALKGSELDDLLK